MNNLSLEDLDLEKVEQILKGEHQKKESLNEKPKKLSNFENEKADQSYSQRKNLYGSTNEKIKKYERSRSRSKSASLSKSSNTESSKENKKKTSKSSSRDSKRRKETKHYSTKYQDKSSKTASNSNFKNDLKRDNLTCIVLNLARDTTELDIFKFLTKEKCGKIRDIKIIRDINKKSKGVAYVEFYEKNSIETAISLSGSIIAGNPIKIQHSQAEKNHSNYPNNITGQQSNKFNKNSSNQQKQNDKTDESLGLKRIYVGGLTDHLADLKEQDIKELFSPFGEIDVVDIHRDVLTGKSRGYAFVQFKNIKDAKEAVDKMDGMIIANKTLKVSSVQSNLAGTINSFNNYANNETLDLDDESGHNFLHNSQSRALLMQKLTRSNNENNGLGNPKRKLDEISQIPTNYLLFVNMYTKEEILSYKNFLSELKQDLLDECKKFGEVKYMFLDPETEGNIWAKFQHIESAKNTQKALNDRFFGGKKISLYFVKEEFFKKKFSI